MGSFEDHIEFAKPTALFVGCLSIVISLPYTNDLVTSIFIGVGGYVVVLIGTSFPDIDHHASRPHRALKSSIAAAAGFVVIYYLGPALQIGSRDQPLIWLGLLFGGAFLVMKGAPGLVSVLKPTHRGITHTLSAAIIVSLLAAGVIWHVGHRTGFLYSDIVGLIVFGGIFTGIYKHLTLDGEI